MFHKLLIIIFLFLAGCNDNDAVFPKEDIFDTPDIGFDASVAQEPVKKPLDKVWYEKIDIVLNANADIISILKSIANKLGVKIIFEMKDVAGINYVASKKALIEVLSDLCDAYGWKIMIKNNNAKISQDSAYMHNYSIPYLVGERKITSNTSVAGASGKSENQGDFNIGSNAQLSNAASLDSFEELRRNLEVFVSCEEEGSVKFFIHKQAGVLSVVAKQKVHKNIAKYIALLSKNLATQILIEAKIFEVELFEQFVTGIDWAGVVNFAANKAGLPIDFNKEGELGLMYIDENRVPMQKQDVVGPDKYVVSTILKRLRKFGKVNSISNPRVMITKNNFGMFKVVDNKVFFKLKRSQVIGSQKGQASLDQVTSEIQTVPIGLVVLVQPSIDANGKIMISFRSTISEVHDEVDDPAVMLMSERRRVSNVVSKIPVVKMRELDTVFTTQDNRTVIIGGLLYAKKNEKHSGAPELSYVQNEHYRYSEKKEIVIMLKARIIQYESCDEEQIFLQ